MRVVVTGAGGFVGRVLVGDLLARGHHVVAVDRRLEAFDAGDGVEGDLLDPAVLARAFDGGCEGVIHLATMPGGAAEADPDGAWRANVDGVRAVAAAAANAGTRPRMVFASSIAVLGDPLPPEGVDDATPAAPRLLYGAHKRIAEEWLATLARRRSIEAISLRLPGIVARPGDGAGLKSAFMSEVFHALAAGRAFVSPVSATARMWLMSARCAAANLAQALVVPAAQLPASGAATLPALHLTMAELVAAIAAQAGTSAELVRYAPDPALEAQFGSYPPLTAAAARALGFVDDGDAAALVTAAFAAVQKEPA